MHDVFFHNRYDAKNWFGGKLSSRLAMTDKERCGQVSSLLPMSCRGSADAFARSLHVRLSSLEINHEDEDDPSLWHRNGQSEAFEYPLSPEEELEDPLSNRAITSNLINPDGLFQSKEIQCFTCGDSSDIVCKVQESCENGFNGKESSPSEIVGSPIENLLETCSSIDELYETASDHSGDEEESWNETNSARTVTPPSIQVENGELDPNNVDNSRENTENETFSSDGCLLEESTPKIRRCSSLKTGKTPPGTPGSKKIVRFADALGLDLADVKTFVDEIPRVPTSAYHDLRNLDDENEEVLFRKPIKINKPEKH
ncbi:hypothetical protein HHI36_019494 [Cryptolaemus montrouzieri]|uniref:Uncharacterized protein n=1 Tax=Cryptolaemus montrouzieri TaxID=559131 RepID=A0ABD2P3B9_9CUCU